MTNCQWDRYPKARKAHRCEVCCRTIPKGDIYHKQSGISDGQPYTWKAHKECSGLYWELNRMSGVGYYDEPFEVWDFDLSEIQLLRGKFPHAVCYQEIEREKHG